MRGSSNRCRFDGVHNGGRRENARYLTRSVNEGRSPVSSRGDRADRVLAHSWQRPMSDGALPR